MSIFSAGNDRILNFPSSANFLFTFQKPMIYVALHEHMIPSGGQAYVNRQEEYYP